MAGDDFTFSTNENSAQGGPSNKRKYIVIAAIVLVVVAIVAIILGVTLSGGDDDSSPSRAITNPPPPATEPPVAPPPPPTTDPPVATPPPTTSPPVVTPPPTTSPPIASPPPTDTPAATPPPTDPPVATSPPTTNPPVGTPSPTTSPPVATPPPTTSPPAGTPNPTTNPPVATPAPTTEAPVTPPPTDPPTDPPTGFVFTPSTAAGEAIAAVARFGGSEFEDPASYQSRSLAWVETTAAAAQLETSVQRQSAAADKVIQLYSLACIWFATNAVRTLWTDFTFGVGEPIPGWIVSTGWLTDADECTWHGITCDDLGRVTGIELNENKLTGSFPPEVALLHASLERIDLFDNLVFNDEAAGGFEFFPELTNLSVLLHGDTAFQSFNGIPGAIGRLTNLKEYDCQYSAFFGPIPGAVFDDMNSLEYLVLDGNSFNSSIPEQIGLLPVLENFYAADAFISGDLSFMYSMPAIFEMWLDDNPGLGGTLGTEVGTLVTLESFSVTYCALTGTIPTEFGNLELMGSLWLYQNELSGTIPSEFGNLLSAEYLDFSSNNLEGEMPQEICALRFPFGILEELGADCEGEVECDPNCCTCCGSVCYE